MLRAIDPKAVVDAYRGQGGSDIAAANLALVYHGRDLDYVLVKELLRTKKVKVVFLTLRAAESRISHPAFCELADRSDILGQVILFNPGYLSNIACFERRQIVLLWTRLTSARIGSPAAVELFDATDGFLPVSFVAKAQDLAASDPYVASRPLLPHFLNGAEFRFGREYVRRIAQMVAAHGAKLVFLYLPSFRDERPPMDASLFSQYGRVISIPAAIRDDPLLRSDLPHFNAAGAAKISDFVGRRLICILDDKACP
jgi:hypothetical protein